MYIVMALFVSGLSRYVFANKEVKGLLHLFCQEPILTVGS